MNPIQVPITGEEPLGDLAKPNEALSQFYLAFNRRDLSLMRKNWEQSGDVAMDNPLGGIKRGWPQIETVYRSIFEGDARVSVEFFDYTLHLVGDVFFYAVGRERGDLKAADGTHLSLQIRTSRLFRKIDGLWRQVHHHGSIDDPDLLRNYRALVLKTA